MDAQDLDQFSVDPFQEFNLRTNHAQLPKQNAIANDHHCNQKGKAERQVAADVESIRNGASGRLPHAATPEVLGNGHPHSTSRNRALTYSLYQQQAAPRKPCLSSSALER